MTAISSLLRFSPSSKTLISSPKHTHCYSFAPIPPSFTGYLPKNHRPITVAARLSGNNNNNTGTTPATDRLISALAYTLPFFNSLQYGRFLFSQFPWISGVVLEPILPLLSLYRSLPYASFVAFFGIYLGIVRNKYFSDYARFNAMQALTLDVLLVLPLLFGRIFSAGGSGVGLKLTVWGHNAVFFFTCMCFAYGLGSSVLGKTPYLPFVADAARRQMYLQPPQLQGEKKELESTLVPVAKAPLDEASSNGGAPVNDEAYIVRELEMLKARVARLEAAVFSQR